MNYVLERLDLYDDLRQEMERAGARPSFWWRKLSLRREGSTFYLAFSFSGGQGELRLEKRGDRFVARSFQVHKK